MTNYPSTIHERAIALGRELQPETVQGLHRLIAEGLAAEDQLPENQRTHGFRRYPDFKEQADGFEEAMRERGIAFTPISW